jgi:hypothetical protein
MSDDLGTMDITCDAPPYYIVQVCDLIGIKTPEDVRWLRLSHHMNEDPRRRLVRANPLLTWLRLNPRPHTTCTCGEKLPSFDRFTFTISTGEEPSYMLGQCARCRTVFWEDA